MTGYKGLEARVRSAEAPERLLADADLVVGPPELRGSWSGAPPDRARLKQ